MDKYRRKGFGRPTVVRCPDQIKEILDTIYNEDGTLKQYKKPKFDDADYTPKRPIEDILGIIKKDEPVSSDNSPNIKDIVKGNTARFSFYRNGKLMYEIIDHESGLATWLFPIDITNSDDIGSASFDNEMKAIYLMRYIRKAIDTGELAKLSR